MCAKPSPSQKQEVVPHMFHTSHASGKIGGYLLWYSKDTLGAWGCPENVVDCTAFNEAHVQKLLHLHGPAIPEPWNHLQWQAVKSHPVQKWWMLKGLHNVCPSVLHGDPSSCSKNGNRGIPTKTYGVVPSTCRSQRLPAFKDFLSNWLQNSTMASCAWRRN